MNMSLKIGKIEAMVNNATKEEFYFVSFQPLTVKTAELKYLLDCLDDKDELNVNTASEE